VPDLKCAPLFRIIISVKVVETDEVFQILTLSIKLAGYQGMLKYKSVAFFTYPELTVCDITAL
jgi:hypothetical protein